MNSNRLNSLLLTILFIPSCMSGRTNLVGDANVEPKISDYNLEKTVGNILFDCAIENYAANTTAYSRDKTKYGEFILANCKEPYRAALRESDIPESKNSAVESRAIDVTVNALWNQMNERLAIANSVSSYYHQLEGCFARNAIDYRDIATADFQLFLSSALPKCKSEQEEKLIKKFSTMEMEPEQIGDRLALITTCATTTALIRIKITKAIPIHLLQDCENTKRIFTKINYIED